MSYFVLLVNVVFLCIAYDYLSTLNKKILWVLFLIFKMAVCLRPLYWDKYSLKHYSSVQIPKSIENDLHDLGKLSIRSWQFVADNDYYPMYTRLFLIEQERKDVILIDRNRAKSDVLFLPVQDVPKFDLRGYRLWKCNGITYGKSQTNSLSIYIREGLN
jgi:hypothetical protein